MTLCTTSSYTLDIALACSITHPISILVNYLSVLMFPLSGKLLQTVKLLTCVRGTSSSWTTAFQPKDSKLHTECKSYDRLWRIQYCVYTSYCCCYNLHTRITEHDNSQPHWMKDVLTAQRMVCTIAGQLGKPSCQPCGVIPVNSNKPQKVKRVALKWVKTRGQNPEH